MCLWARTTLCPGHRTWVLCAFSFRERVRPSLRGVQQSARRGDVEERALCTILPLGAGRRHPLGHGAPGASAQGHPLLLSLLRDRAESSRSLSSLPCCLAALSLCLGGTCPVQVRVLESWSHGDHVPSLAGSGFVPVHARTLRSVRGHRSEFSLLTQI